MRTENRADGRRAGGRPVDAAGGERQHHAAVETNGGRSHWNFLSAVVRSLTDAGHAVPGRRPRELHGGGHVGQFPGQGGTGRARADRLVRTPVRVHGRVGAAAQETLL